MILTSSSSDHGLGCISSWTTPIIQEYVRNTYDDELHKYLRMLWRLCLRYTRPTYVLVKLIRKNTRRLNRKSTLLNKLLNQDMVPLYQDETHVRAYRSLHATWSEVGKQKQVSTYGHHASVTLFGALNAMTGEVRASNLLFLQTGGFFVVSSVSGESLQRPSHCHGR